MPLDYPYSLFAIARLRNAKSLENDCSIFETSSTALLSLRYELCLTSEHACRLLWQCVWSHPLIFAFDITCQVVNMKIARRASFGHTQVPATLVCSFLGSSKTSLVNVILSAPHQQRIVVVVNEFGEMDIDSRLGLHADDSVIALRYGYIRCTVRSDLNAALHQLLIWRRQTVVALVFDRMLIAASGVASPVPTVQSVLSDPFLSSQLSWDAGIARGHAQYIVRQICEHPKASAQIAYADHIVLNHCDRCPPEGLCQSPSEGVSVSC